MSNKTMVVNYEKLLTDVPKGDSLVKKTAKVLWENSLIGQQIKMYHAFGSALAKYGGLTSDDVENVNRIIRAGKAQDVKEMDIELSRDQWLGLKARGNAYGADVDVGFGTGGKTDYKIHVKYK